MKKIIVTLLLATPAFYVQAQTLEQANRQLYYERYQSAANSFHQLLRQDAANANAWYGLTEAYIAQKMAAKAYDSLQRAPAAVKEHPLFKAALGASLLNAGKSAEASPYFNQALTQTREKDAVVLAAIARAHIYAKNGDAQAAIEWTNKAIKRKKNSADLYILLGDAYRKLHDGSEAYKAYRQALEKDEKSAAALHRIGEIFLSQKNAELYLEYFNKAVAADAAYAPALYQLYVYEFYHDPTKAIAYYNQYAAHSDASLQKEYDLADLLYLTKDYDKAIQKASEIAEAQKSETQPRLYKLMGYSYAAKTDTARAISFMEQYFTAAPDSQVIAKDYETMSQLYTATNSDSLALSFLAKAAQKETDSVRLFGYYKQLANLAKSNKNYPEQAKWLALNYTYNSKANNLDLYYWGLAHYMGGEYTKADSVFGLYAAKYPEQSFGYYWQAKSQALADKEMTAGLAVPTYKKLIEVLQKDSTDANYKKWIVEAYAYLAAYEANTQKDYAEAVDYFEKLLEVDPQNADAKKYMAILEKQVEK